MLTFYCCKSHGCCRGRLFDFCEIPRTFLFSLCYLRGHWAHSVASKKKKDCDQHERFTCTDKSIEIIKKLSLVVRICF